MRVTSHSPGTASPTMLPAGHITIVNQAHALCEYRLQLCLVVHVTTTYVSSASYTAFPVSSCRCLAAVCILVGKELSQQHRYDQASNSPRVTVTTCSVPNHLASSSTQLHATYISSRAAGCRLLWKLSSAGGMLQWLMLYAASSALLCCLVRLLCSSGAYCVPLQPLWRRTTTRFLGWHGMPAIKISKRHTTN